ncbi:MAG: helix-turn-helix domain-containing protein [Clostridium sp.]
MLNDNIKNLMREKGLTSRKLAEIVGVSTTHISYVLNNKRDPSVELLEKIASALEVNISDLYNQVDKKDENELTGREKLDIEKEAQRMIDNIDKLDTVEFCGTPADEDDKEYLKLAYEKFLTDVRIYNKKKYTPNKYKK